MAAGDSSDGTIDRVITADTVQITFTAGPRAGTTWVCRARLFDAYEPFGVGSFIGKDARKQVEQWALDNGPTFTMLESGLDQWGRLCGAIIGAPFTPELRQFLRDNNLGSEMIREFTGTPDQEIWRRDPPHVGGLSDADLIIDGSAP